MPDIKEINSQLRDLRLIKRQIKENREATAEDRKRHRAVKANAMSCITVSKRQLRKLLSEIDNVMKHTEGSNNQDEFINDIEDSCDELRSQLADYFEAKNCLRKLLEL